MARSNCTLSISSSSSTSIHLPTYRCCGEDRVATNNLWAADQSFPFLYIRARQAVMVTVEDEGVIIINDTNGVDCTSASPYYIWLLQTKRVMVHCSVVMIGRAGVKLPTKSPRGGLELAMRNKFVTLTTWNEFSNFISSWHTKMAIICENYFQTSNGAELSSWKALLKHSRYYLTRWVADETILDLIASWDRSCVSQRKMIRAMRKKVKRKKHPVFH